MTSVLEKFRGITKVQNQIKGRKSLQTLQVSSDENIVGRNMVLPDNETITSKKKQSKVVDKVINEKENAPVRRSKRKNATSKLLSYAESPNTPQTSTSVSSKSKSKKTVVKPKNARSTTAKKNKPEIDTNQKKLNFTSKTPVLKKSLEVSESANPENSKLHTSPSSEIKVTEDSGIYSTNGDSIQSPVNSAIETCAVKHPSGTADEETSMLTCDNPPLNYWMELAEQRREALEKALYENELLHDQLVVLEAENSQLKELLKEAENLAQIVRDIVQ